MTANTSPIYTADGHVEWCAPLTTAAADYTGFSNLNAQIFDGESNGGFCQRIRCKALGTNIASVLRVYVNTGLSNQQIITTSGTPTGTPSATGGTMAGGSNYAKIVPIGEGGDVGVVSTESALVTTTSATGVASILWAWTAPANFNVFAYRVHVGIATNAQAEYFWCPRSSITASQATTILTVTAILSAPNTRICAALQIGSVFATGIAAGTYIINQLTSSEADGSLGRTGTYTLSASATVGSTTCTTNPLTLQQLSPAYSMVSSFDGQPTINNNCLIAEVSLPATTASATIATPDVEYPLNFAIPAHHEIYAGLGTTVAAGWQVSVVGGHY